MRTRSTRTLLRAELGDTGGGGGGVAETLTHVRETLQVDFRRRRFRHAKLTPVHTTTGRPSLDPSHTFPRTRDDPAVTGAKR